MNPPLRKLHQIALNNAAVQQYIVMSLRCIPASGWCTIEQTQDMSSWYMWHQWPCGYECCICWSGVGSPCGKPVVVPVLPENDRQAGWIVTAAIVALVQVSSSHQAPAAPTALSQCTQCHLSAYIPVLLRVRMKEWSCELGRKCSPFYLSCTVSLVYQHIRRKEILTEAGGWRDTPLFILPLNRSRR